MHAQKKEFYEGDNIDILHTIEQSYQVIKEEFLTTVAASDYQKFRLKTIYNTGWDVFGLRWFRRDFKAGHKKCPALSAIIYKYDDLVESIGFSILAPGTIIYPHVGFTENVLRCHLGIEIPEGDCAIRVGTTLKKWEEGHAFIFDDTIEHEAWNKTDSIRIILLIDICKDLLFRHNPHIA